MNVKLTSSEKCTFLPECQNSPEPFVLFDFGSDQFEKLDPNQGVEKKCGSVSITL